MCCGVRYYVMWFYVNKTLSKKIILLLTITINSDKVFDVKKLIITKSFFGKLSNHLLTITINCDKI